MPALPSGTILLWSGSTASIPGGFVLCDGTLGTPDLRDRFIRGASGAHPVGATGGSINHTHTYTGDGHTHNIVGGIDMAAGAAYQDVTSSSPAAGTTDLGTTLPPYYALAYIMKT